MSANVGILEKIGFDGDSVHSNFTYYQFPTHKTLIGRLTHDEKMAWYSYQFEKDPRNATLLLSTPEFASFWKWRVLMPMKLKRFYYRVKTGQIFRRYEHISEIRKTKKQI